MKTKTFDCIQMKRRGAESVHKQDEQENRNYYRTGEYSARGRGTLGL